MSAALDNCPSGFSYKIGQTCVSDVQGATTWYAAERACRRLGGHLPTLSEDDAVRQFADGFPSLKPFWTGAIKEGTWRWADGSAFTTIPTNFAVPSTPQKGADCLFARNDNGMVGEYSSCSAEQHYVCTFGTALCAWEQVPLRIDSAILDEVVTITDDLLKDQTMLEIGLGSWPEPARYVVNNPAGVDCKYVATFSAVTTTSGAVVYQAREGCADASGAVTLTTVPWYHNIAPKCVITGLIGPTPPAKETKSPPGVSDKETDSPISAPGTIIIKEDEGIPAWIFPVAFGVVAMVSIFIAVGATRRRGRKDSDSGDSGKQEGPRKYDPEAKNDAGASSCCETCKKFSEDMARERLHAVHDALQKEFAKPLGIVSTRCDHVNHDHIHVFTVENDFDASSLGALSTVYSRTKPRLPRNTRIHIEHAKKPDEPSAPPQTEMYQMSEAVDESGYDEDMIVCHYGA